jgi:hypothetical protein
MRREELGGARNFKSIVAVSTIPSMTHLPI